MILRRITQHVRDQNWTAIAIDLVIVVVGVFLGIQVSNWNASRVDHQVETRLLRELQSDVEADLAEMDEVVLDVEDRIAAMTRVLDAAGTPYRGTYGETARDTWGFSDAMIQERLRSAPPPPETAGADLVGKFLQMRTLDGNRHSYTAIVNTGSIRLIGDAALARQIQTYYANVDEVRDTERYFWDRRQQLGDDVLAAGLSRGGLHTLSGIGRAVAAAPGLAANLSDYRFISYFHWAAMLELQDEARRLVDALPAHSAAPRPDLP
ncbi:hypothetical protein [Rubrivirga sp. IMCC43871]|uniref:hypothetical protein n=1 Tax=Rubrivirga sp. IMCC43871 TaxID=3391575 RepID=UPI00398F9803